MIPFFAVLKVLHVPPTPGSHASLQTKLRRIDFAGSGCLVLALASLLTALDRGGNIGWNNTFTLITLACAIAMGFAFIVVERTFAHEPVAPPRILSNRALLAPYICSLTSLGCSVATVFYVALYVQAVRGRTAAQAGVTLLPSIGASVLGSLFGGAVIQRTGRFTRLTTGMYAVMVGGSTLIAFATGAAGWHSNVALGVGLFMMSIGNGEISADSFSRMMTDEASGCGLTTTLVALIAQAGSADQAVATAGKSTAVISPGSIFDLQTVSYLFRSLGSVLCLSVSSTIFQATLRRKLHATLEGADVDEVRAFSAPSLRRLRRLRNLCLQDRAQSPRSVKLHRRARAAHPRRGTRSIRAVVAQNIRLLHLLIRNVVPLLDLDSREAVGIGLAGRVLRNMNF